MKFLPLMSLFLSVALLASGCASAPKKKEPVASAVMDSRDQEIARLKEQLEEQRVETAEAEARAAKAENDLREAESFKSSKPKDPYLK